MRRKLVLSAISNVGVGTTAGVDLPCGKRRYFAVYLIYKVTANQATIEADLTEIRLLTNGKVQRRFSAADLNVINATYGIAFVAGMVPIILHHPRARTITGEEGLAWGTANVDTFRIEVDISGAAAAPTLTGFADVDDVAAPLGPIIKWSKDQVIATGAGAITVPTLAKRDSYFALHARSVLITRIRTVLDGLDVFDVDRATYAAMLARRPLLAMQANNFSLIFADSDQVTDALPMTKDDGGRIVPVAEFRNDFTFSGAGTVNVISERVGQPE